MTPTDIFRLYILTEEQVTIKFASDKEAKQLLQLLRTAKSRHHKTMEEIGMAEVDNLKNKIIAMSTTTSDSGEYLATFSTAPAKSFNFEIVSS